MIKGQRQIRMQWSVHVLRCQHHRVNDEQVRVLARDGNVAVTWLDDRAYPGLHVQGDTFAELYRQLADAANRVRRTGDDGDALDDLDDAISQMRSMLFFYESTLAQRGVRLPYPRDDGG